MKLEIELVPRKQWGLSLAQLLPKKDWDVLRRKTYRRYSWTCQICGLSGTRVHCHEEWYYDDKRRIQRLVALRCLCEDCHNVKHWGRTISALHEGSLSQSYIDSLRKHYCEVNGCTEADMMQHIVKAGEIHMRRSRYQYKMDLSGLKKIVKEMDGCLALRLAK